MVNVTNNNIGFENLFQVLHERSKNEPEWLKLQRLEAKNLFLQKGLPDRRYEEWKYTSVSSIAKTTFQTHSGQRDVAIVSQLENYFSENDLTFVFLDGRLVRTPQQNLPVGVQIRGMEEFVLKGGDFLKPTLGKDLALAQDSFELLNQALFNDGYVVQIAKDCALPSPLHFVFVSTKQPQSHAYFYRNLIVLEEHAQAKIIESYVGIGDSQYLNSSSTDIRVGRNARLEHCKIQAESSQAFHVGRCAISLERNASCESFNFDFGSLLARNNLDISLTSEGAEAILNGLYALKGSQHVDNHTTVDHMSPHTTSSQVYKGVLTEKSHGVFDGKIFVRRDAQQTRAHQLNKNILLSENAEIDTKPQLEIEADDVKCSHGATVGQLNADEIFYLRSRGISNEQAKAMLCHAFASEVVFDIKCDSAREKVNFFLGGFFPE
jgi:Fe-S cluster assembly protein SufD